MNDAISIFDEQNPGCQALFVFDQSSAHASLGEDALRPFTMKESDGGKQKRLRSTIIPDDDPTVHLRGRPQSMINKKGEAKGLQSVLQVSH